MKLLTQYKFSQNKYKERLIKFNNNDIKIYYDIKEDDLI